MVDVVMARRIPVRPVSIEPLYLIGDDCSFQEFFVNSTVEVGFPSTVIGGCSRHLGTGGKLGLVDETVRSVTRHQVCKRKTVKYLSS